MKYMPNNVESNRKANSPRLWIVGSPLSHSLACIKTISVPILRMVFSTPIIGVY